MTAAATIAPNAWMRNVSFDFWFIGGIAILGIATGLIVSRYPQLFLPVLAADLWLLGYHHVISTYTRLSFDRESFAQHRMMVLVLPIIVAAAVTGLVMSAGLWLVPTIYLYWQWYHYTRQSEGISKAYAGKNREREIGNLQIARAAFWLVPVAGILAVSARSPETFLFMPVKTLFVPEPLLYAVYAVAGASLLMWLAGQYSAWRKGRLALPYFLYMLSHFSVYAFAYILIEQINYGWLTINIWHNAQYILFVWMFNNRRFGGKVSTEHRFISTISQNGRFMMYIATCLAISTAVYYLFDAYLADALASLTALSAGAAVIIIYQTVNFHHYIVDSRIWKLRKKPIRQNLGIK